ncbi:RNA polymerase-binding transcription factor DksA [Marinobacterium nitratireducens]|uniref:RNA polymerase-binding transcription factor DksA n=1 Tax=Marinobacterium nitratireducens TaxID=518897 RepID=A0A917Z9M4_9GAMM|nr:RNA polymerase-binding protein DksA [Marinobacterium nitratireducens]GGO76745.1 RNA polymerase-binding transcription factor DksA [Marinobacterium nitratireducens]
MLQNANQSSDISFTPYVIAENEDYMNDEQLAHFRQILLKWRTALQEEIAGTVGHLQQGPMNHADPLDRATHQEEMNLELRTRDRESKLIRKIDKTLERIREEDYGYCDTCGIEIGIRRLEARPTADLCVDCKNIAEIKERTQR